MASHNLMICFVCFVEGEEEMRGLMKEGVKKMLMMKEGVKQLLTMKEGVKKKLLLLMMKEGVKKLSNPVSRHFQYQDSLLGLNQTDLDEWKHFLSSIDKDHTMISDQNMQLDFHHNIQ